MSETNGSSRSGLLKRGLVLAAGALGIGAAGGAALSRRDGEDSALAAGAHRLKLYGRNWLLEIPDRRQGERLRAGERGTVYGELLDRPNGKRLGQFYGARTSVATIPGSADAAGSMELHTFRLEDGTILGMGSEVDGETIFAVIGGTGRYAGVRGSYIARQGLRELGGDGTAEFDIDLRA